ncbi:flagellar protein FlaG [Clostridium tetanomorphum]|uniref:Flagellar protein FlaG n=1 Tax=Clostridium tetanomorphum TaxID=1553 RepID=A0A923J2F0_CLOTT|nr:flagellar protein FlaG [Clostridium tetanomorphum]MBC2398423.1 flagellar protein FlaG [Clostridium tetanomorphum]NRZ98367.1 flagellar protein FlaG [Clostridium tetanomorphum]
MDVKYIGQGRQETFNVNQGSIDSTLSGSIRGENLNGEHILNSSINAINNSNNDNGNVREEDVKKSVDKLNKLLEGKATYVEYEVYGKLKSITIKIMDSNTKKVVKEIPPKKIIDMVDKLCELAGMFMDEKA